MQNDGNERSRAGVGLRVVLLGSVGILIGLAALMGATVYAGLYNVAADIPHSGPVYWFLDSLRERSIAVRSAQVTVPANLDDPKRIALGAGQYAEMCASCHLAPGMKRTEISRGLYPRASELRRRKHASAAEDFWVVKHGIKLTGMPAWGITHSDDVLWDVVAFLQKLPELTAEEYRALVESVPKTHLHEGHSVQSH